MHYTFFYTGIWSTLSTGIAITTKSHTHTVQKDRGPVRAETLSLENIIFALIALQQSLMCVCLPAHPWALLQPRVHMVDGVLLLQVANFRTIPISGSCGRRRRSSLCHFSFNGLPGNIKHLFEQLHSSPHPRHHCLAGSGHRWMAFHDGGGLNIVGPPPLLVAFWRCTSSPCAVQAPCTISHCGGVNERGSLKARGRNSNY